jgi:NAD(P)-dependent dehydrogenase (short-subunit alcohol dehydrogenase family)
MSNAPDVAYDRLFRLDGRTVFVSGAAGHLGQAMTRGFLSAGARVILNGRQPARLDTFRAKLRQEGYDPDNIAVCAFDVRDEEALSRCLSSLPRLDALVNNAITVEMGTVDTASPDQFASAYDSGVRAAFSAMRIAEPALLKAVNATGHAAIVNVASMYGVVSPDPSIYGTTGLNSPPHYGPVKAALIQLTRHMACHWGSKAIRVNAIAPGPFPRDAFQREHPEFATRLAAKTPLGRVGTPNEIAGAAVFLASDAASYVTGAVLNVDGGWTAW